MFRFFLKRYFHRVSSMRGLFLLALIPACIYFAAAASRMDRFTVYQDIKIAMDTPLALAGSPSDFARVDWFLANQADLFMDTYAIQGLGSQLTRELDPGTVIPTAVELSHMVKTTMSLAYDVDMLRINYSDSNEALGRIFVAFYARKIIRKAEDGIRRQELLMAREAEVEGTTMPIPAVKPYAELFEGMKIYSDRALWRNDRFLPLLLLLVAGAAAVMLWIGIMEFADTSFKSERQVARLLHVPVLGSVPNMSRISRAMGSRA